MSTKTAPRKRRETPSTTEIGRDVLVKAWRAEAKEWITKRGLAFINKHHEGATGNPDITIGQVMAYLDSLPPVVGYELLRADNNLRYQVVRACVEQLVKDGKLEVGSTVNTHGRNAKCFSPVGWKPVRATPRARRPSFDILTEGPAVESEQFVQKLNGWLEENAPTGVVEFFAVQQPKDEP
jgi:hypothetical protein